MHSQSSLSLSNTNAIEKFINKAIENKRLVAQGINPAVFKTIDADVEIENTIDSKDGSKKGNAGIAYAVSFACGILIYMMMIIYGTQVMRGVMEEKTNRIAEVIVSSVKPFQLMMGKIIRNRCSWPYPVCHLDRNHVCLTITYPLDLSRNDAAGNKWSRRTGLHAGKMATITQGLSSLPILKDCIIFLFYFLGGYLNLCFLVCSNW